MVWGTVMLPSIITFQSFKKRRFVIRVVTRQMVPSHSLFCIAIRERFGKEVSLSYSTRICKSTGEVLAFQTSRD